MKHKNKRLEKAIAATMKHAERLRDDYGPDIVDHPRDAWAFKRAVYRVMDAARRVGQIETAAKMRTA